ncbi:XrtA/PEP-CTERM system-associated ATPase [Pelovirga terrestris]|uniref:AAA family ATPase n=1 Tax=Pelovirga terrestris TaxID=2771352 RepID=A0A8J6QWC4_9BACT|nr:XrtA/PEP-CTERM system-associated ATPase [Pelovirga terrestris]MBD1399558.1 AAA family ATPase [Pelovirga terrestris]
MYTKFFDLSAKPFDLLPNPQFLYLSKGHRKALSYLQYGVQERAGFSLLTGEVGSGKTTILRDIINKISGEMSLAMVFNTQVDGHQLIALINDDFGLKTEGKDKVQLINELNDFLLGENAAGRQAIIIIDEAQNLSEEALEEIRLLSNLEADSFKLVQIILVGQPELKQIIARPSLRQLRQRISISCHLNPLNREEIEEYILHRLGTVGKRDCVTFEEGVFDGIFKFSGGIPRLINLICDFLMLSAFVEETRNVDRDMVQDAINELSFEDTQLDETEERGGAAAGKSVSPARRIFTGSSLDDRVARIEENYAKISAARAENEAIIERLSSQGSIIEYLINQQQKQYIKIEDQLKRISSQVERLRQAVLTDNRRVADPDIIKLESVVCKDNG